jgi:hypothetical protein
MSGQPFFQISQAECEKNGHVWLDAIARGRWYCAFCSVRAYCPHCLPNGVKAPANQQTRLCYVHRRQEQGR